MFTEKDIINTDSFVSIADLAILEARDQVQNTRSRFARILSWVNRKTCRYSLGGETDRKRFQFTIPEKEEIVFFIKTDFLEHFLLYVRPHLDQKFKIITGDSSYSIPSGGAGDFESLLSDDLLVAWYGYNFLLNHPKLNPIPLGIPTKRALELGHDFGDNALFLHELNMFLESPERHKKQLIYWGSPGTTIPSRTKIYTDIIRKMSFATITERRNYKDYLNDLMHHRFVICPEGSGVDTLRFWESLYFRAVPVVKRHLYLNHYEHDFPILYLNDWSELRNFTPRALDDLYSKLMQKDYEDKLRFSYWKNTVMAN